MKKQPRTCQLATPWMEQPEVPWNEYPRPQLRRDSFLCLNGTWTLSRAGRPDRDILVPYPPESRLSGLGEIPEPGTELIYRRTVTLPGGFCRGRVILHIGAADQYATVLWNGRELGTHEGGYLPFSFDVTDGLAGENRLEIRVRDPMDRDLPWGKQSRNRGGMWYTPVSGIWQTVWLESVPEQYIEALTIRSTMTGVTITTRGGSGEKRLTCDGKTYTYTGDRFTFCPEEPKLWSPEEPNLYPFTLECGEDRVESYFALREIGVKTIGGYARLCLNGKPYFFHGLLDQGYYPDGIYLPGSPEGYTFDVAEMKRLGFNTLRKHIKIEPERFYYDCDRLGMVVFQDLVNSGGYSYLIDTVLPNGGVKKGFTHRAGPRQKALFRQTAEATLRHLGNHPCVLYYTLFNEGWGQHDEQALYEQMKQWEPDRIWDATSGWFWNCDSDVLSEHIYFGRLKLKADHRPLVLSEFGGYSHNVPGHCFNLDKVYGYKKFPTSQELEAGLAELYRSDIIPQVKTGLCAAILTQVSDVEDETNGLVTYDRQVTKVRAEVMEPLARALRAAMEESTAGVDAPAGVVEQLQNSHSGQTR